MLRCLLWYSIALPCWIEHIAQVGIRRAFPKLLPKFTGNFELFGVELDCLVKLAKVIERFTQIGIRKAFPSPVPKLKANVEMFGVELDRFVELTKAVERTTHVAIRPAFPGSVISTTAALCFDHASLALLLGRVQGSLALFTRCACIFVRPPVFLLALARTVAHRTTARAAGKRLLSGFLCSLAKVAVLDSGLAL